MVALDSSLTCFLGSEERDIDRALAGLRLLDSDAASSEGNGLPSVVNLEYGGHSSSEVASPGDCVPREAGMLLCRVVQGVGQGCVREASAVGAAGQSLCVSHLSA